MPFNVVGPDDAVLEFALEVEDARAKDPDYPWTLEIREGDGPVLHGDHPNLTDRHHRSLIDLTKRHPEVVVVTGQVDRDNETAVMVNADLIRYAKGRRRTVAKVRFEAEDRGAQIAKMIRASLRYECRTERV